ncbi:hypothetical protein [Marinobacter salarius]|uniref:Uncharacterized protein n=1 Tax=Marinobacter salarius TaxID=1420917 RepID=A0A1W6K9G9_9GAMM|nr:hypothetical protein [Marinobacter salarius]ARM83949.1 hypothetical protein MARSALSMR5_01871 [Marinobacter salarius]
MNEFTRKAYILRLKLIAWIRWLAVELEPANSENFRTIASKYAAAKGALNRELLKDRERRMNRRVF